MRMLMTVQVDNAKGAAAVQSGQLPKTIQALMEKVHPEAAYFSFKDGQRCGYVVFDLTDQSQVPAICEPLLIELGATIELTPAMNAEDLAKGMQSM